MKAKDIFSSFLVLPLTFSLLSFASPKEANGSVKGPLIETVTGEENVHSTKGRKKANEVDTTLKSYRTIRSYTSSSQSYHVEFETDSTTRDLIFGYYGEGERNLPFTVQYSVVLEDGGKEIRETACHKISQNNNYDGIGNTIGSRSYKADIDLPLQEGESVEQDSLKYFNIFKAERTSNGYTPLAGESYYYDGEDTTIEASAKKNVNRGENLFGTIDGISSFGSYASFSLTIENNRESQYGTLKASAYRKWKDKIESGEVYFEERIPSLKNAVFQITYKDGRTIERSAREGSLNSTRNIKNGKHKYFRLFKDLSIEDVSYFSLARIGFSRKLKYTSSEKDITGTEFKSRVGRLTFYSGDPKAYEMKNIKKYNFNRISLLSLVLYLVLFGALATCLFFYRTKKYRNDEFRRVNPKRFLIHSIIVSAALGVFLFDIFFIFLRANPFNNTRVIYNPVDNFIVILSILSIFAIGYFVKSAISAFKNWQQRKEQERLRLDDRESDDGTK